MTPFLTKSFTVYAVDLPGFGDSPVNQDVSYDQPYMTNTIVDFVVKKKLSKLTLVGESIGGVLCATVASMLPKKVERIFVFNPYDYDTFFGEGVRRANRFARLIIWSMSLPVVGNFFTALENRIILWFIFRGGAYNKKAITFNYISLLCSSIRKPLNVYHTRNVFLNFKSWADSKKQYSGLETEVTLVYGVHDWSSLKERRETQGLLSPQSYVELDNVGHFSFLEVPEKPRVSSNLRGNIAKSVVKPVRPKDGLSK